VGWEQEGETRRVEQAVQVPGNSALAGALNKSGQLGAAQGRGIPSVGLAAYHLGSAGGSSRLPFLEYFTGDTKEPLWVCWQAQTVRQAGSRREDRHGSQDTHVQSFGEPPKRHSGSVTLRKGCRLRTGSRRAKRKK